MKYNHKYEVTKGLKPEPFFYWFGEISACPRPSGNEKVLIEYIRDFAEKRNLECDVDEAGNVFIRVPATSGYEDYPSYLLQAHMDMVTVKEDGVEFDFSKDALNLAVDGDKLYAQGTTLGADNGAGLAVMLALGDTLTEEQIPHPPLELLFTVEEETGLKGIKRFDCSKIKSRKMLNFDAGAPHRVTICCGGSIKSIISERYSTTVVGEDWNFINIRISGGLGGHGADMINKGRACAVNTMGELLTSLIVDESVTRMRICSLKSSEPEIIKECECLIAVPEEAKDNALAILAECFDMVKDIYKNSDPDIKMELYQISDMGKNCNAVSAEDSEKIAQCLSYLETAMYRSNYEFNGAAVTGGYISSANLTDEGVLDITFSVSSSINSDMRLEFKKYVLKMKNLGMELKEVDSWCGWAEDSSSALRDTIYSLHKELFNADMATTRCLGSVEVGVIKTAIPDMDAVCFAPHTVGAHTTKEHILISQVQPFWELLKKLIIVK